ncbi:hypothetical protein GYMLUDRAFT_413629 [Collybiopsis luxurians FD-317 M1]|nr:hypothetical protein GYMLUDRAFT_413629 [Collybiopsis luxurians FD-317 M1]
MVFDHPCFLFLFFLRFSVLVLVLTVDFCAGPRACARACAWCAWFSSFFAFFAFFFGCAGIQKRNGASSQLFALLCIVFRVLMGVSMAFFSVSVSSVGQVLVRLGGVPEG